MDLEDLYRQGASNIKYVQRERLNGLTSRWRGCESLNIQWMKVENCRPLKP